MQIYHKIINKSGKDTVYIYVTIQDIYEFGKENLGKGENTNFLTKLRAYINENLLRVSDAQNLPHPFYYHIICVVTVL